MSNNSLLKQLESQSIYIFREVAATAKSPVLLYSIGKDSSVLLHLARKAFYPGKVPFPLLHVDTTWKFREMITFRDQITKEHDIDLIVHTNPEGLDDKISPFSHSTADYTHLMKTVALKQALDHYGFDMAIGGARRDEEKSRAKEKVFSIRTKDHTWSPKGQRQEFWDNYNTMLGPDQTLRAFPLSNWTELDIWRYIEQESIPVVPLYFAKDRPVVRKNGSIIMVDDHRMPLGETPLEQLKIRFRTLGCYPLTAGVESKAATVSDIIEELAQNRQSERQGRLIDHDDDQGLEQKKKEGYF
jgi:sulfate adenylyltransferase subunit 2